VRWAVARGYTDVLVIAPYSAFDAWRKTLHAEGMKWSEFTGLRRERQEAFFVYLGGFALINYEALIRRKKKGGFPGKKIDPAIDVWSHDWDAVVLDESYRIANPRSAISKTIVREMERRQQRAARLILTGLPRPENDLDYFQQLRFLGADIAGAADFWKYRMYQCYNPPGTHEYFLKREAKLALGCRLAKHAIFLKRTDVRPGQLEKQYERVLVRVDGRTRKVLDKIEDDFILEIDGEIVAKTVHTLVTFHWMRKLLGGVHPDYVYHDKVTAACELINETLRGEQVLIWCDYVDEGHLLSDVFSAPFICGEVDIQDRSAMVRRFQSQQTRVLVCQPQAMKYGVDLSAASASVYYSSPLGLDTRVQSEDRMINLSQKTVKLIYDIVCENTVEEAICDGLKKKANADATLREIVAGVKARIERRTHR